MANGETGRKRRHARVVVWFWVTVGLALSAALILNRPSTPSATAQNGARAARPTPTQVPGLAPQGEVEATAGGYANLVVTSITVSPEVALVGEPVAINVTVANIGNANPSDGGGKAANFFLDLFVSPPVATADDLLSMPGYAPTLSAGMQSQWLPPGGTYTVVLEHTFTESGMHSLYAVVDTVELGFPYGHVHEGGAAGELDNAFGPVMAEARFANVLVAKNASDFSRGPASSLALVKDSSLADADDPLTTGDAFLTLGYFEETPNVWGLSDPLSPDYNMDTLDQRLSGNGQDGPQEWPRLAAKDDLVVAVWQDRRNSQLTNYDIYLSWSMDQGDGWTSPIRVNDDGLNTGDQRRPAVAISPVEDRVLVVWQDSRTDATNPDGKFRILGQWYVLDNSVLTPAGSNQIVSTAVETNSLNCDVAAGPEGNFYVVWQDDRAGNTDTWLRAYSGSVWMSSPRRVSDDPLRTNQRNPRVAAGRTQVLTGWRTVACPDGVPVFATDWIVKVPIVVVWEDDRSGDWDVYVSYSVDEAQTFAVDHRVNDDGYANGVDQKQPVVGVAQMWQERQLTDEDGICTSPDASAPVQVPVAAFYTAWQDFRNQDDDQSAAAKPSIYMALLEGTASESISLTIGGGANERVGGSEVEVAWQEYPSIACSTYDGSLYDDGLARHNAFIAWSEWGSQGPDSSDVYLAVRGDGGAELSSLWRGGAIPLNSGAHATNLEGSTYLGYEVGDPPAAYQVRPSLATNISKTLPYVENGIWKNKGYLYVAWDDNRTGGYERDVYFTRSNMTYFADYDFYPDPMRTDQIEVGKTCRYASGSYISPIYDMGEEGVTWDRIEWHSATPSGTYITLQTRVGDDPNAMGQWMPKVFPYESVGVSEEGAPLQGYDTPGQMIVDQDGNEAPHTRYIQYRVNMWAWPVGGDLSASCGIIGDDPVVYDPVVNTPVLYSVFLHHQGGTREVILPIVAK